MAHGVGPIYNQYMPNGAFCQTENSTMWTKETNNATCARRRRNGFSLVTATEQRTGKSNKMTDSGEKSAESRKTKAQTPLLRYVVDLLYNKLFVSFIHIVQQIHNESK